MEPPCPPCREVDLQNRLLPKVCDACVNEPLGSRDRDGAAHRTSLRRAECGHEGLQATKGRDIIFERCIGSSSRADYRPFLLACEKTGE